MSVPACPRCNGEMVQRTSQFGKFWGCRAYPTCRGTRDGEALDAPRWRPEPKPEPQVNNAPTTPPPADWRQAAQQRAESKGWNLEDKAKVKYDPIPIMPGLS